ncbi:hypothetical protein BT69DRAFT_516280 [Atractiella rhizophila]|nr:hypothetical protein BT69DRAFT_516280 [Atractiella rhizophila]
MEASHVYSSSDPYPTSFNPEETRATDLHEVPPFIHPYQPPTVPFSNLEARPWRNAYSQLDRRAIPMFPLINHGFETFRDPLAAYLTPTSNDFGFPWTSNPLFVPLQNHQANHPPYAPLLEPIAEYPLGLNQIYPTSKAHSVSAGLFSAYPRGFLETCSQQISRTRMRRLLNHFPCHPLSTVTTWS